MPKVSCYLAAASLSSFSVPQSGQTHPSSFCLIVLLQLFSLILQDTSCISVWLYLQPGVTLYRLHQPVKCHPHKSHDHDNSLGNKSFSLQMNFFSLLVYWKASFYSYLTMWKNKQHSDNVPQLAVHVFAIHVLMHQDIHSRLDWVKIHKTVSFLVTHGSCLVGVLEYSPV